AHGQQVGHADADEHDPQGREFEQGEANAHGLAAHRVHQQVGRGAHQGAHAGAWDMYDSGIRNFEGAQRLAVRAASTSGRNTATVAVLLTNAASPATSTSITSRNSHCQRIRDSTSPTATSAPLRCSAPLSTNMAATMTVAWLLKPERASGTVITPLTISAVITSSATTSTRSF